MAKRPKKRASAPPRRAAPAAVGPPAGERAAPSTVALDGEVAHASAPVWAASPAAPPPNGTPAPVLPPVPPSGSFLPTRTGRVTSRAERRREAEAALVPLDETPAIPVDRVPFIGSDLRRIGVVALVMVACIIVGTVIFR